MLFGSRAKGKSNSVVHKKREVAFTFNLEMITNEIHISHLGAKDCVTGSCHLIEAWSGPADSVDS